MDGLGLNGGELVLRWCLDGLGTNGSNCVGCLAVQDDFGLLEVSPGI
jgi:hypothetical protein